MDVYILISICLGEVNKMTIKRLVVIQVEILHYVVLRHCIHSKIINLRETLSERHQQQTFNQALLETGYRPRDFPNKGSTKFFSPIETKYYEY